MYRISREHHWTLIIIQRKNRYVFVSQTDLFVLPRKTGFIDVSRSAVLHVPTISPDSKTRKRFLCTKLQKEKSIPWNFFVC